jgi:hypothetical protein
MNRFPNSLDYGSLVTSFHLPHTSKCIGRISSAIHVSATNAVKPVIRQTCTRSTFLRHIATYRTAGCSRPAHCKYGIFAKRRLIGRNIPEITETQYYGGRRDKPYARKTFEEVLIFPPSVSSGRVRVPPRAVFPSSNRHKRPREIMSI